MILFQLILVPVALSAIAAALYLATDLILDLIGRFTNEDTTDDQP